MKTCTNQNCTHGLKLQPDSNFRKQGKNPDGTVKRKDTCKACGKQEQDERKAAKVKKDTVGKLDKKWTERGLIQTGSRGCPINYEA